MMSRRVKTVIALSIISIISITSLKVYGNEKDKRVIYNEGYTITKLSNPTSTEGEADGLVNETDRANGYVWGMAESGQYIYMGTNRNFLFNVVRQVFGDGYLSKAATDIIFKGDIATDTTDFSGKIIRYNKQNGEFETAYSSEMSPDGQAYENAYRSGLTFKAKNEEEASAYLGSYGGKYTRVLKFKPDYDTETDKPEVVFSVNSGNTSVRAIAEHNEKMYLGSMIIDEDLRILESDNPSVDNWKVIADLSDFNNLPPVAADSTGTAGVFDLISYNGYLYAIVGAGSDTSEEKSGFMVFKGKDIGVGSEGANEAGWKWEVVVGDGGKYDKGMGVYIYNTATAYKYTDQNGKEYVYVGTFPNAVKSIMSTVKFDFSLMYNSFMKPTQLYRFDENDNWEMVIGTPNENEPFTEKTGNYKAGFVEEISDKNYSSNQYVWRMSEYNGKLFAGTFDAATLYDPFVPDKIDFSLDKEDEMLKTLLAYSNIINKEEKDNSDLAEALREEKIKDENIVQEEVLNDIVEEGIENNKKDVIKSVDFFTDEEGTKVDEEMIKDLKPIISAELTAELEKVKDNENLDTVRNQLLPETAEAFQQALSEVDIDNYENYNEYLEAVFEKIKETAGEEAAEKIKEFINEITGHQEEIQAVINKIIEYLHSNEIIKQYTYITKLQDMIADSEKGFDLFVSEDGINFEKLTTNGFDDGFNMGLRTFISSEDGLFIGTANPFYGCQLWRLNDKSENIDRPSADDNTGENPETSGNNNGGDENPSNNDSNAETPGNNENIENPDNISEENQGEAAGDNNDNIGNNTEETINKIDNDNKATIIEESDKPKKDKKNRFLPVTGQEEKCSLLLLSLISILTGSIILVYRRKKQFK